MINAQALHTGTAHALTLRVPAFSPREINASAQAAADALAPHQQGSTRQRLLSGLNQVQPQSFPFSAEDTYPLYAFSRADGIKDALVEKLLMVDETPDWEYPEGDRERTANATNASLDLLQQLSRPLYAAMLQACGCFLFAKQSNYHGGSRSAYIGVVTFMPQLTWTREQYSAHILHELVHQTLFLHDMVHGIFRVDGDNLSRDQALVTSAILRTKRPYDRAYHSTFVLHAIYCIQEALGKPLGIRSTRDDMRQTLRELNEKSHYLYDYGAASLRSLIEIYGD